MPLITFDWFTLHCAFWLSAIAKCFDYSLLCTKHSNRTTQTVCFGLSLVSHSRGYVGTLWPPPSPPLSISPPSYSTCSSYFSSPLLHLLFLFLLPLAPPAQSTMVSSSSASPQLTVPVLLALDTPLSSPPRNQTPPVHYKALKLSFLALFVCDR